MRKSAASIALTLSLAGASAQGLCATPIERETRAGIAYVTGGIGAAEQSAMQALKAEFNTRMTFAEKGSGAYLADLQVTLHDAAGRELASMTSRGPWLFAQLPQAAYRVTVRYEGASESQKVTIPKIGHRELYFYFLPAAPSDSPAR